jgi:hypothetical protein
MTGWNLPTKPTWNYPISAFKTLKFKTPLPTCSILTYSLSVLILLYLSPAHSRPCQPSLGHGTEATLGNQLEQLHDKDIPLVTVVQFSVACLNKYPPHLTLRLKEWLLLYASVSMLPHQFFVLINIGDNSREMKTNQGQRPVKIQSIAVSEDPCWIFTLLSQTSSTGWC